MGDCPAFPPQGEWSVAPVMEVISPDNPNHDYKRQRTEYAQAGIPEYWIVDPQKEAITVLTLQGGHHRRHGEYMTVQTATSVLLDGFSLATNKVFATR